MGVILASAIWLKHWDGLPEHCWRAEHETNLMRQEVQVRLKRLTQHSSLGGYVLKGSLGTGKRELVRAAFQHPESALELTWISGSNYGFRKSYGAIQFLLTGLEDSRMESPLAVYGLLKQYFTGLKETPLIVMENVGLIDPLTTAVLCQLVSNNIIKMVVLDDLAETLSEDLSALVRSGLMEVFQVNELTLNEARTQISMMLDVNISYLTAIKLWTHAAGSSETLRAVVLDCRDGGLFDLEGESASLRSDKIPVGVHMEQYVAARLERLDVNRRKLLEQVALSGTLPEEAHGRRQDKDIDFIYARGLLEHSRGHWKIANPAIAQTLAQMHSENAGWHTAPQNDEIVSLRNHTTGSDESRVPCQPTLGYEWQLTKHEAMAFAREGTNDSAIEILKQFLALEQEAVSSVNSTFTRDRCDAMLLLLEYCLFSSQLEDASNIILALEPTNQEGYWSQLNLCQQYRVLAFLAEYLSRTNEHREAEVLLEVLLKPLNWEFEELTEYRISECMEPSLRSLINVTMSLSQWEQARRLVQLVLSGALRNLQLVAYAETIHAIMLVFAGNYVEAQKIIAPLQQQVLISGTKMQSMLIDSVSLYISDQSGQIQIDGHSRISLEQAEAMPMIGLQWLWQSIRLVARQETSNVERQRKRVEELAQWAENRGETLVASHLWALVIRHGGFHVAPKLRQLQDGYEHGLAVAFKSLSDGAESKDPQLLATAVGSLAALGFIAFANDDGAKIFECMNAGQRRKASRKVNDFMSSLQPELIHPDIYAGLGRLTVLTEREKFVASAAASGLSNLEIAEQASVSVRTVEGHLYQVYSKLGISKRGELYALTGAQPELNATR